MLTGVGAAAWVVFPLYFNAYYPANDSGRAIGVINFVRSIALIAATAGSGFIAEEFGLQQPFFLASILGIFAVFALLFTKESRMAQVQNASWRNFQSVASRPMLLLVSVMAILLNFAVFTGVFGFIPIYATEIGASKSMLGLITMINLGSSALGALSAVWVWEKFGYRLTMILSALLIGGSLLSIPFIEEIPLLMAVQVSGGLGSGVLATMFMVLTIRGLPQEQQATAMGVFQAVYAIGMLAGPLTSGFLGNEIGLSIVFYLSSAFSLSIALFSFLPTFSRKTIS
jgi:predicted MFS family arabinose efflux permease